MTLDEMKELVNELNKYRNSYYNDNYSIISDQEYDILFDKLVEAEKELGIVYANSPTQTVGYKVVSKLKEVKHNHPLMSLDKTTNLQEFKNYFGDKEYCVMAKMDGLTCSLLYRDGKLVSGESRGNGEIGEDITHTIATCINLPKTIPFKGEIIVDGECIISQSDFDKINAPLIEKAEQEANEFGLEGQDFLFYVKRNSYANPRNLVSGTVRQLNSEIAAQRNVRFIAWKLYSIQSDKNDTPKCKNDTLKCKKFTLGFEFLKEQGFEIVPHDFITGNRHLLNDCEWVVNDIKRVCATLKYPIDGCVGAFDDIEYGESLGSTGHHPKHSIAFKFYQEGIKTTLRDIEWSTSRSGLVNPVAILDPVIIDDTIVHRATLNNVSFIKELKLGIGDIVSVIKANQIIPQIKDNITRSDTYEIPTHCPTCGKPLTIRNDNGREMLYCTNPNCTAILHDKISNFVSREGMNIVGLSDKKLLTLMNLGYIKNFGDIYRLKNYREEIEKIDGFGKSSVDNILAAIEESKNCKFANVLVAIGIPGIGKSTAKSISKYCVAKIADMTYNTGSILGDFVGFAISKNDWSKLESFGDTMSNAINSYVWDNDSDIIDLITYLNITEDNQETNTVDLFGGQSFCITGKLHSFVNRDSLVEEIERYGGKVVSSVSAKTNYLITNDTDSGSSKNQKAKKYGTKIITEDEFIEMCRN
jgi:DNA ligase (NAD+)